MIPGKKYSPEDFLYIVWDRKWLIALPFVIGSIAAVAVGHLMPNQYRSESLIQIVPQRVPETYVKSTVTSRIEDRLQDLRQQVLNRTRLERIIEDFKLFPNQRKTKVMEDLVDEARDHVSIEIVKGDAFKVSYTADSAKTAMQVTERLASLIIEENLRDRESLAEGANQFFETQLDDARQGLLEHEKKLEAYRREHAGELPSQQEANLRVLQSSQSQLQSIAESINRDRDQRLLLQRLVADATPVPVVAPKSETKSDEDADSGVVVTGSTPAEQLESARTALRALETRLTERHPDVVRMKRIVAELTKKAETANAGAKPTAPAAQSATELARRHRVDELQAQIESLDRQVARKQEQEEELHRTIAAYQARVDATPTRESELVALTRDYDTLQKVYTNLLAKKEDSKVAANLERRQIGEQFKILDPARLPEKPISPNRAQINVLGAIAGLGLGIALVAFLEFQNKTIRSDGDVVSTLSLTVLAMVPVAATNEQFQRRLRFRVVSIAAMGAMVLATVVMLWRFA
jgi:polysaccharide chain length determinant protein (PEP-CTERM system associated)